MNYTLRDIISEAVEGGCHPFDGRRLPYALKRLAIDKGLAFEYQRRLFPLGSWVLDPGVFVRGRTQYIPLDGIFDRDALSLYGRRPTWRDLPIDYVWGIVAGMLTDGYAGYSITKHPDWELILVHQYHGVGRDLEEQTNVLNELASWSNQFIYFLYAGSVWEITARDDSATETP